MKKTTLQILSVIGLVVLMSAVSVKAQTQYRAHVPFDFTIGTKDYQAGDYVIDVISKDSSNKAVAIRDAKSRNARILMATLGEDYSKVTTATLVFDRFDDQYSLSMIRTPSFGAKLNAHKVSEKLAGNQKPGQKTVALTTKN